MVFGMLYQIRQFERLCAGRAFLFDNNLQPILSQLSNNLPYSQRSYAGFSDFHSKKVKNFRLIIYKEIILSYRDRIGDMDIELIQDYAEEFPRSGKIIEIIQMEVFG